MILDEQCMFSYNQAITENCVSENVLDLGKREVSFGTPVEIFIQISETFDKLTSLNINVQTSVDEDFTSPVSLIEQEILLADLVVGNVSAIKFLPKGNLGYMRLSYTVTGTNPTQGRIIAAITDGSQESFHNM